MITDIDRQRADSLGRNLLGAFFDSKQYDLEADAEFLELFLRNLLTKEGLSQLDVKASSKEKISALEKITRKCFERKSDYAERLLNKESPNDIMTDLVRARITCRFSDQIDVVKNILQAHFEVDEGNTEDHRIPTKSSEFGYAAMHLVCMPIQGGITQVFFSGCKFEIQIRSSLMDIWGVVNWDVDYKSNEEVPYEIKRRLSSVAALFYLIDREFIAIRHETEVVPVSKDSTKISGGTILSEDVTLKLQKRQISIFDEDVKRILVIRKMLPSIVSKMELSDGTLIDDNLVLFLLDRERFMWTVSKSTAYDFKDIDITH